MKKIKDIKTNELKIKPYNLNLKGLEGLKKTLVELKKKRDYHKSFILQLSFDIEEMR